MTRITSIFATLFTVGLLATGHAACAATDNGFGDDTARTGYFTVASYKAFGTDDRTPLSALVAGATPAAVDPASLNEIKPAGGAPETPEMHTAK